MNSFIKWLKESKQEVIKIHQILIRRYGGIQGIRDVSMLESALERPYSGIEHNECYPSPEEKASAILERMVRIIHSMTATSELATY